MKHSGRWAVHSLLLLLICVGCSRSSDTYEWSSLAIGGGGFVSAVIPSQTKKGLIYARTDVGGAYRWDQSNEKWVSLLDWVDETQRGYLGVESLAIDPQSPNKLYMLVGIDYFDGGKSAILKSNDYGATFQIIDTTQQFKAHGNGMGRQSGEKLMVDPNNSNVIYTGTRRDGLFKSSDAGLTWSQLTALKNTKTVNDNGISFVLIDANSNKNGSSQTLYIGISSPEDSNLFRSEDGGLTFNAVVGAPRYFLPQRAVLAGDGDLYITYANGAGPHPHQALDEPMDNGAVWKYNTLTKLWTDVTPAAYSDTAFGGISVDPKNPDRLVVSSINTWLRQEKNRRGDRFFLTNDGGKSWTDIVKDGFELDPNGVSWLGVNHSIHWSGSIEFDPFEINTVWVTSGNGVYRTKNINAKPVKWAFTVEGLEETVPLGFASLENGTLISVIGDFDGFIHQSKKPERYGAIHHPEMGTTMGLAVAAKNNNKILRVGSAIYYSEDAGQNWTQTLTINGIQGQVALSAEGSIFLHSPIDMNTTYQSSDGGGIWTKAKGLNIKSAFPTADPMNNDVFYAYDPLDGGFYRSNDGGNVFSLASKTLKAGIKRIGVAPKNEGDIWIALKEGGLARSTDYGDNFTLLKAVAYCGAVGFGVEAKTSTYPSIFIWGTVKDKRGIFMSIDEGETWERINDDQHQFGGPGNGHFVSGDKTIFGRVYMSSAGRGIIYGKSPDEN